MRIALVHYWLVAMRGGEKVLEALLELFPDADIFTHVYVADAVSPAIKKHRIRTSFIQKLPFAQKHYQKYLPLMPFALEQLDLRGYDLVISSESGPAKGILTDQHALHICYCHSPMRYLWDFYQDYLEETSGLTRLAFRCLSHRLRIWDAVSAQRVDYFIANSGNVAQRIRKHYRRDARVIHPPVDIGFFSNCHGNYPEPGDYYLCMGQLTRYKRVDLAVDACGRLGRKLIVIGEGAEMKRLKRRAGPMVTFMGRQDDESLRRILQKCRAVLFPGEEDFGLVPLEALSAGRPVIAYAKGGALETVRHEDSGIFFFEQTVESLCTAIEKLEAEGVRFSSDEMTQSAHAFSRDNFHSKVRAFVNDCCNREGKASPFI